MKNKTILINSGTKGIDRAAANVTRLIIKDSDHFVSEEQPQPLAQAIINFCAGK